MDGHGDEGPETDKPPTDWSREEWLGVSDDDGESARCGPVQLAMWGYYLEPFEEMKEDVEAARESEEMAEHGDSDSDVEIPDEFKLGNPGEAVEKAKYLGIGENQDLAGDEMIHSISEDGRTVFMPAPSHEGLIDVLREEGELSKPSKPFKLSEHADVRIPFPSESVQLLYPEQSIAADAAEAMGLNGTHEHDYEGEVWYMPGESHSDFISVVEGMGADSPGYAPVAKLSEYKSIGMIDFRGTREGELDESEIPADDYDGHYFNPGSTKSESSYPLVDSEGYLRRGNLQSAWSLRGQGSLGMPRDSAERLLLNLGLVFGPEESEANPLPEEAYEGRETGTPYAAESTTRLGARLGSVTRTDEPHQGEVAGNSFDTQTQNAMSDSDTRETAALGKHLANAMKGGMERMSYHGSGHDSEAEMMEEMAGHCGMSKSHMRSVMRGDTGCPSIDVLEAASETLDLDMGMLVAAAEKDGCEYSMQSGHGMDEDKDDEEMTMSESELKEKLTDKRNRIEQLEARVEELEAEREQVASEYAEALAAGTDMLSADLMQEKFEVAELAEMYQDQNTSVTETQDEPAVRSGDGGGEAASLAPSERQRKQELESQLADLEGHDGRLAEARRDELESKLAKLGE